MTKWGFSKLNDEEIDDILDAKQATYLLTKDEIGKLNETSTDEQIKKAATAHYQAIIDLHNNRKPDGLLDLT